MNKLTVWFIVFLLLASVVGFCSGYGYHKSQLPTVKADTIILRDTTKVYMPVAQQRKPLGAQVVRLPQIVWVVEEQISQASTDSVEVALPIERVVYENNNYRAVVEGYQPKLVEMELRGTTTTIVKTIPTQKKGWDVAVGPTVCWGLTSEGWRLCVGIGGTITWRF